MDESIPETLVPIVGILVFFGLPIGGWIAVRMMTHRERMEMLRRGIVPPPNGRGWRRMPPGAWTPGQQQPDAGPAPMGASTGNLWCDNETAQDSLRRGIKTTMVGLALLIGLSFIGYRSNGPLGIPTLVPGPWLLGGLIPTFIGMAQILIAVLSGARIGPSAAPGNPPPPSGAATYEPPPTARPVNAFEELPPSMRPPERR